MGPEVDLLELLVRQMGVDLRGRDIRVTEHLLKRTQIAPSREQMGGKRVPESVRAHAPTEPGGDGVPTDDLVQPLARQRATAKVDEHARMRAFTDEGWSALSKVVANRP